MSTFAWTDAGVREALGLRSELARPELAYEGVSTDSRSIRPGDLYVALVGDRFDGHDFVVDALARGARGAVVSAPVAGEPAATLYPVDDTLVALGRLAAYRRAHLQAPVVGITGSVGKTTTKEMVRGALGAHMSVHATEGNLNNRIGMPLTLLAAPVDAEAVILEMGTNQPGEIGILAAIATPDVAVLTTVGEAHLELLGSVGGVLQEKLDLLRHMAPGGKAVVGDEPGMLVAAARSVCPDVRVAGWSDAADPGLRPADVEIDAWGGHRFHWKGQPVTMAIPGRHAVANALLALAVSEFLGVPAKAAAVGVSRVQAGSMRGEVRRVGGLTVVVDCYNANPQSVRAALDLLHGQTGERKVAVLGSMLELGPESHRLHVEVLRYALSTEVDLVVATGAFAQAAQGITVDRLVAAPEWASAYPLLRDALEGTEVVLLKASRGVALEGMLPMLESDFGAAVVGEA